MNKMHAAVLCAFFILLALNFVQAEAQQQEISLYSAEFNIVNGNAVVSHQISFENPIDYFEFALPEDAKAIDVYINGFSFKTLPENDKLRINQNNISEIKINYLSKQLLERTSKVYFLYDLKIPLGTDELKVKLILPEQAILDKTGTESVFPKPDSMTTDGQHIVIEWGKNSISKGESFSMFVTFREKPSQSIIAWIIAVVFVIIAVFLLTRKPKAKKAIAKRRVSKSKSAKTKSKSASKEIETLEEHLLESEKKVIDALKESKGMLWQKQIQLKTGFSKAKLSRVIRNLEARKLIKKIPLGNTNKIKLK